MCQKKKKETAKKICLTLVVNSNTNNRISILKCTISSVICCILQFYIWDTESEKALYIRQSRGLQNTAEPTFAYINAF